MKSGILAALTLLLVALAGCGGGVKSANTNSGKATVKIDWPPVSRLIPAASDNVRIVITKDNTQLASKDLNRPAQGGIVSAVFTDLPVGTVTVTATALPDPAAAPHGETAPLARASLSVTIVSGENTPVDLTMASTIDHINILPNAASLFPGASLLMTPNALGAISELILLSPARLVWESSAPGIATVDALGNVTAVSPGAVDIKVTDTESGKSGHVTLTVSTGSSSGGSNQVRFINLPADDLVYDPVSAKIYASIPSTVGGSLGNTIVAIDPITQSVSAPVPVGKEPNKLALSDDGQYLYIGLDGEGAVRRLNLKTMSVDLKFSLGIDSIYGQRVVEDMAVVPGSPQTVVISMKFPPISPRHAGIAVFDNGVARALTTQKLHGGNRITFGASPTRLYGLNNETTGFDFFRYNITPDGISLQDDHPNVLDSGPVGVGLGSIVFSRGRLYASGGQVIDPETLTPLGTLVDGFAVPDTALNRVFVLQGSLLGPAKLKVYNAQSLAEVASTDYVGVSLAASFIRWGPQGIAWRTQSGKIALVTVAPGT